MFTIAEWAGKKVLYLNQSICEICRISFGVFKELIKWNRRGNRVTRQLLLRQILFTGIDAFPMISLLSLLLGTIVVTQSTAQLPIIGGENFLGTVIVLVIIRELGPLITAIVVIGRSGAAIAAELGLMRINHETEALEVMGINITRVLVLPRLLGCIVATVCLTIYFDLLAILGGYAISRIQLTTSFNLFLHRIILSLQFSDLYVSLMKSAIFGIIIAILSSYHGLKVKRYATEVPQATTKAVISSIVVCFFFNSALTMVFYM